MKQYLKCKISFVFVVMATLFQSQLIAQTPTNGIIFQAVARDQYANPAKDRKIFVQSSIIQSTVSGVKVLIEEYETSTDASGVFSIAVGNGKRIGGTVTSLGLIDWAQGPYFLNLNIAIKPIAPVTGWDYTKDLIDLGTSTFGTVPYALYSGNVFGMDKKLNIADSTKYVTPTQLATKTFDQTPILNSIATKLNIADSTKYVTPTQLATKTFDQTPILNSIATKLNLADSLTKYVTPAQLNAKTFDSSAIYSQLALKANDAAVTTALGTKANSTDVTTALNAKEILTNKSISVSTDGSSDSMYPSVKAVKTYVDAQVTNGSVSDADPSTKGKLKLAGDLTGTSDLPLVAANAITTAKVADAAITNSKLATGIDATKISGDISGKASNITGNLAIINGGTGASTAAAARTNLGLLIGTDVQAPLSVTTPLVKNANTVSINQVTPSVDGYLSASDYTNFTNKIDATQKAANNGVATLGSDGKIPSNQIPAISFQSAVVVNSQSAMLALSSAVVGSIAIRTDVNKNFVLSVSPASTLSNWIELATPSAVTSVNGAAGPSVTLTTNEIAEGVNNKYYTDARVRGALSAVSPLSFNTATGAFSMTVASASNNGYLAAADFTTFNNKQNALTAGTDYLAPNGTAAALTNFPIFNQSTTGNAATATKLAATKNINGVAFDGSADITILAASSTLTGTTLATNVVSSSLTSLGTVTTGVWSGTTIAIAKGGTGATTAAAALTNLGAEPSSNKSTATDLGSTTPSDALFPSQKAVKAYVDAQTASAGVSDGSITNAKLAGNITASKLVGTDITTVGTISAGTWSGTTISIASGGTSATTVLGAKTNLGLNNVENTALSTWTGSSNITNVGSLTAIGKTFTFQDLVLGYGTTQGKISTDGGKSIQFYPTYNVESTRFWPNGNVTIQHGGTYTDNGFTLEVGGTSKFIGNTSITGNLDVTGNITGATWSGTAIANNKLANSTLTIGSTNIALGATSSSLAGLSTVTSTNFTGALTGNAATATALATGRTISATGDIAFTTGSFNGTANVTGSATLTNTAVTAGSYGSSIAIPTFTVDSKGRLTAASTVGIIAGVNTLTYATSPTYATGGTISGTTLTLSAADATNPGMISTIAQTIAGAKTFSSNISVRGVTIGIAPGDNTTNTVLGGAALGSNTTGTYNTAIGGSTLFRNSTGSQNIAGGQGALENSVNGNNNAAIGSNALFNNTSGSGNAAFGIGGLYTNTIGSNNTSIGFGADVASNGLTNATAIGYGAIVTGNNRIQLGNSSVTSVVTSGTLSATGFTGPLTGNVTGNASTATKLAATKNINGVAFDGSADITLAADAGTLTGTTLKSTVVNSSLTGVGTITSGTWNGSTIAVAYGGTGTTTSTGTGSVVLSTSPSLTTPNIGAATGTSLSLSSTLAAGASTFSSTVNVTGATTLTALTTTGAATISNTTSSTSSSTGALVVRGGVGIASNLTVGGTIEIDGGSPGAGKVLTSDASGLASWTNAVGSTVSTTTTTYAITLAEAYVFYTGASAGAFTIPAASSTNAGKAITIKNKTAFGITITPSTTGNIYIDNSNTSANSVSIGIEASNNWIKLVSDGTQWNVIRALF